MLNHPGSDSLEVYFRETIPDQMGCQGRFFVGWGTGAPFVLSSVKMIFEAHERILRQTLFMRQSPQDVSSGIGRGDSGAQGF